MKKILFLIALLSTILFAHTAFAIEGDGTEESPFLITTQEELCLINDFPDCHFKLMNDIELQGEWTPLCSNNNSFTGLFDGNGKTISNLSLSTDYNNIGLFSENNGSIKNISIATEPLSLNFNKKNSYIGLISAINNGSIINCNSNGVVDYANNVNGSYLYIGGICGINNAKIENCKSNFSPKISMLRGINQYQSGGTCYVGGISGVNHSTISLSTSTSILIIINSGAGYIGGISGITDNGSITNSYFNGHLKIMTSLEFNDCIGGISANCINDTKINNCYSVCTQTKSSFNRGIAMFSGTNGGIATNCFYDSTISTLTDTLNGLPKSTTAMKMKKTYTDAGWDFENVWGISPDINDGYPYLLWEHENDSSANAEIIAATATDNSLKFITEVSIEGEPNISTFGTTFIPLWLFETGSTDTATVEYNNEDYNIQNGQTFGATLTEIPASCKDTEIVGKSYIKTTDGNYKWSSAKYASVTDATLKTIQ